MSRRIINFFLARHVILHGKGAKLNVEWQNRKWKAFNWFIQRAGCSV